MEAADVIQVLDALDGSGVRHWVAGGWGVAALAGLQTRWHRDLDLAVDAAGLSRCLAALGRLGYAPETDWLPSRIELRSAGDRWVDVHPVALSADGSGRQADQDGGFFDYPPDAFGRGLIAGRAVPCLSARQQRRFRAGYQHRPEDIHDLAQLDTLDQQGLRHSCVSAEPDGPYRDVGGLHDPVNDTGQVISHRSLAGRAAGCGEEPGGNQR